MQLVWRVNSNDAHVLGDQSAEVRQVSLLLGRYLYLLIRRGEQNTGSSKKMDGIWNRYNLKSTGRIYTFGVLKCSEKFKVLDLCKTELLPFSTALWLTF